MQNYQVTVSGVRMGTYYAADTYDALRQAKRQFGALRGAVAELVPETTVSVYESDGSDGYTAGTWGYVLKHDPKNAPTSANSDGGFPSRETAQEALNKSRKAMGW